MHAPSWVPTHHLGGQLVAGIGEGFFGPPELRSKIKKICCGFVPKISRARFYFASATPYWKHGGFGQAPNRWHKPSEAKDCISPETHHC